MVTVTTGPEFVGIWSWRAGIGSCWVETVAAVMFLLLEHGGNVPPFQENTRISVFLENVHVVILLPGSSRFCSPGAELLLTLH